MLTHHYRIIALICALAFCPGVCPPARESAASIELRGGRLVSTQTPQRVTSTTADDTLDASIPRKPAGQEWYYYVKIRQADGDRI